MSCSKWVAPLGAVALTLVGWPLEAQSPNVANVLVGNRATALVQGRDGSLRVETPDGGVQELALGDNMKLNRVESLAGGWVALGTQAALGTRDLFLIESDFSRVAELPPPPGLVEERYWPVPLAEQGRLVGVAWIEGDSQPRTSVVVADWDGQEWSDPEVVSPVTGFAQLAVSAAVLDDGSWLLLWAAVDGHDDEIFWSRRLDGSWSAPQRVHEDNAMPDIRPAVAAVEGGAVAAWSWLDGSDYRMRLARFDGSDWILSAPFGEKGSLEPGFQRDANGLRLLYGAVRPAQWEVVEIDRLGQALRRAVLPATRAGRPQLVSPAAGVTALRFPALDSLQVPVVVPLVWEEMP